MRSSVPVPKGLMFEIARALREVELPAPVADHQMVLENALGSGVDVVTSRGMEAA